MKYKTGYYFFIIFVLFLPTDVFADSVNIGRSTEIFTESAKTSIGENKIKIMKK